MALQLFLCLFAAQASLLTLSPILPEVARDFGMSTAAVGQLRSLSGLVAGAVALLMAVRPPRASLRRALMVGLTLLATGSLASAVSPAFWALAGAQVPIGIGLAITLSAGLTAADRWAAEPGDRARLLSWALAGQPGAWIVGMPIVGFVGDIDWRYSWIAVPFVAGAVAAAALGTGSGRDQCEPALTLRHLASNRPMLGWAVGELFAYSAWAGTLVFGGALFVESYGVSLTSVGIILAGIAVAYLPGNILFRRWLDGRSRALLVGLALALAGGVLAFGSLRVSVTASFWIFAVLAFLGGGRTIVGSALGLDIAGDQKMTAMSIRTASLQFGYLVGAALGGVALGAGGYSALGIVLAGLFVAGAVPHALALVRGEDASSFKEPQFCS